MESTSERLIKPFPIMLFAVVMGLSGLTTAYEKAWLLFNFPPQIFMGLLFATTAIFALIFGMYAAKIALYPQEVLKELHHPVKVAFFAAIPISFLLLSISWFNEVNPLIGMMFWYIGTPLQLVALLYTFSRWIRHEQSLTHANPAWFIPIVGTILIPVVGVDVAHDFISMFFFSVGLFFWIIFFAIVLYRVIFHDAMQAKFVPTLFILIAPPAVGMIAYFKLTAQVDFFVYLLYSLTLFFVLLLLSMGTHFKMPRFFISWWAYTFPLDAATLASMLLYEVTRDPLFMVFAFIFLALSTLVISFVAWATLREARAGTLLEE